jgi:hypothetical protein
MHIIKVLNFAMGFFLGTVSIQRIKTPGNDKQGFISSLYRRH